MVGALGHRLSGIPIAFGRRLMVLRTTGPGVVGEFMIVPDGYRREQLMQPLQVGITPVGRIAAAVIFEAVDFAGRIEQSPRQLVLGFGIPPLRIFIDVIAEVEDQVDVIAGRRMGIGIEPASWQIGAGKHRDLVPVQFPDRQGFGPANVGARQVRGGKAVEIPASRIEIGDGDTGAPVVFDRRQRLAAFHHPAKLRILGNFPTEPGFVGADVARPQGDGTADRIKAADAVGKAPADRHRQPGGGKAAQHQSLQQGTSAKRDHPGRLLQHFQHYAAARAGGKLAIPAILQI